MAKSILYYYREDYFPRPAPSSEIPREGLRARIACDVERFLAAGGTIYEAAPGESALNLNQRDVLPFRIKWSAKK